MKTGAIVQARMGSTRLPGKVLRDLASRPVLAHVVDRLALCRRLDAVIVATTDRPADDAIAAWARANTVTLFRGSEDDVLARYHHAAAAAGLDVVVRITADCPLIDPVVVDEVIDAFHAGAWDLVTNAGDGPGQRTYPRGLDVEVFSAAALREAFARARTPYEREHVTPYLYDHARVLVHRDVVDRSAHRWTLDTEDDERLIAEIYRHLYRGRHDFRLPDVIALVERHPELPKVNAHVKQTAAPGFDARLELLLDAHGMRPRGSRLSRAQEAVAAMWRGLPPRAQVVLWGDREHVAEILNMVGRDGATVVALTGAGAAGGDLLGHPLVSPKALDGLAFDTIVVATFRERAELAAEARRRFPHCDVLDCYDVLAADDEAERLGFPFYLCGEYVRLFELRQAYETATDPAKRESFLFDLAALYFEIRDFVHGIRYAEAYVAQGGERRAAVQELLTAVRGLLAELTHALAPRTGDAALFLVDSLRAKDIGAATPFLCRLTDRALTFTRAFSASLYTLPAVPAMLTGKLPLDDGMYDKRSVSVDESPLLRTLAARGYRLDNYVSWKDFFAGEDRVVPVRFSGTGDALPLLSRGLSPRVLWSFVCRLAAAGATRTFSLLHLFYEVHDPHLCGHHETRPVQHLFYEYLDGAAPGITRVEYRRQFDDCLRYVDGQLAFYFSLLPDGLVKVVAGDHGQAAEGILDAPGPLLSWADDRIHVAFLVQAPGVGARAHGEVFSTLDAGPVLLGALAGAPVIPRRAYAPVQMDPIYNARIRATFARVGGARYARGFKALRGAHDKLVLYDDGAEEYYVLPDERTDRRHDPAWAEQVRRVRAAMPDRTFPDTARRRTS